MTRGICFIAFGAEYDKLAAHTIAYSRKFISCPITVLSNIKNRNEKWNEVPEVNFIDLEIPTEQNRRVKIELHKYSPYDETLYMDVDAVIVKPGIEKIFDFLKDSDIVFQHNNLWRPGEKYSRIYRDTAKKFGLTLPLRVYLGGFWAFRKTPETISFFDQWLANWTASGCGRDMPSLACAIKQTGIKYELVFRDIQKLFSFGMNYDCVAVHRVRSEDLAKYGIPIHRQNKPFDMVCSGNWDKVDFESNDKYEDENIIIKNKNIEIHISKIKGGTIRKVLFGDIDSGIKRAGCEFWSNVADHYEQEYGKMTSLQLRKQNGSMFVDISASLVSPQLKKSGGRCETVIEITDSGKIISKAKLFPDKPIVNYDQYYCFQNEIYPEYRFIRDGAEFEKIQMPGPQEIWWYLLEHDISRGVMVRNKDFGIKVSTDEKLIAETGIHQSRSMMEIKCKDYMPERSAEFCEMTLEKV